MNQKSTGTARPEPDTPGRPKPESTRQQTQPDQGSQTGNSEVDSKAKGPPASTPHVRNEK
jgi:hypothetical protein